MKKRFPRSFAVIIIIAGAVSLLMLLPDIFTEKVNAQDYKDYICYDTNLTCMSVKSKGDNGKISRDKNGNDIGHRVVFRKIKGVDDDRFVQAATYGLLEPTRRYILQNPNDYVDVWKEWTVDSVEFYYLRHKNPSKQKYVVKPDKIVDETTNEQCIRELRDMVLNNAASNRIDERITAEPILGELSDTYNFYIRVKFKESDNIVWDAYCRSYYSEEDNKRSIKISMANADGCTYLNGNENSVNVDENTKLYDWIWENIKSLL